MLDTKSFVYVSETIHRTKCEDLRVDRRERARVRVPCLMMMMMMMRERERARARTRACVRVPCLTPNSWYTIPRQYTILNARIRELKSERERERGPSSSENQRARKHEHRHAGDRRTATEPIKTPHPTNLRAFVSSACLGGPCCRGVRPSEREAGRACVLSIRSVHNVFICLVVCLAGGMAARWHLSGGYQYTRQDHSFRPHNDRARTQQHCRHLARPLLLLEPAQAAAAWSVCPKGRAPRARCR